MKAWDIFAAMGELPHKYITDAGEPYYRTENDDAAAVPLTDASTAENEKPRGIMRFVKPLALVACLVLVAGIGRLLYGVIKPPDVQPPAETTTAVTTTLTDLTTLTTLSSDSQVTHSTVTSGDSGSSSESTSDTQSSPMTEDFSDSETVSTTTASTASTSGSTGTTDTASTTMTTSTTVTTIGPPQTSTSTTQTTTSTTQTTTSTTHTTTRNTYTTSTVATTRMTMSYSTYESTTGYEYTGLETTMVLPYLCKGDINLDGMIDSDDLALLRRLVAGDEDLRWSLSWYARDNADIDYDGEYTQADIDLFYQLM